MTAHLGPGPIHRSETHSTASPIAGRAGSHFGVRSWVRPAAGLATVVAACLIVGFAVSLFRGDGDQTVPITVLSPRAGLVMNPEAKVKLRDVQVGRVVSIEERPDGQAAIHLAMDPAQLQLIPANVDVDVASSTVFGAKFVELVPPADPAPRPVQAGQTLDAEHVTVEINTVFDQLTSVLSKIEPDKLNETLGAVASGLNGRGDTIGHTFDDFDHLLATLDPSLANLSHSLAAAPEVLRAYGDAAPDLISTVQNVTTISHTVVDQQHNLDALLMSAIGLADIGNDVVSTNRQPLTDVLHLLVPTTDLTKQYNSALTCGLAGSIPLAKMPPVPFPGIYVLASFLLGAERYRYPSDLPKVAATGGPHCADELLPNVPYEARPPFLVTNDGANPWKYGNQLALVDSDAIKQALFGPIDGPPRNTAQIGQPG